MITYQTLCTLCLRYNICSAWFLDTYWNVNIFLPKDLSIYFYKVLSLCTKLSHYTVSTFSSNLSVTVSLEKVARYLSICTNIIKKEVKAH